MCTRWCEPPLASRMPGNPARLRLGEGWGHISAVYAFAHPESAGQSSVPQVEWGIGREIATGNRCGPLRRKGCGNKRPRGRVTIDSGVGVSTWPKRFGEDGRASPNKCPVKLEASHGTETRQYDGPKGARWCSSSQMS